MRELSGKEEENENTERTYVKEQPILQNLNLSQGISEEEYQTKKKLQKEVSDLMYEYYEKGISQVLVFEGVDAAGKDGAIERLIKDVDPRLYTVYGISAPSKEELARHYLWRFYSNSQKTATSASSPALGMAGSWSKGSKVFLKS